MLRRTGQMRPGGWGLHLHDVMPGAPARTKSGLHSRFSYPSTKFDLLPSSWSATMGRFSSASQASLRSGLRIRTTYADLNPSAVGDRLGPVSVPLASKPAAAHTPLRGSVRWRPSAVFWSYRGHPRTADRCPLLRSRYTSGNACSRRNYTEGQIKQRADELEHHVAQSAAKRRFKLTTDLKYALLGALGA